ncbi:MAG: hypothetical protein EOP08_17025, partial [Proteobacteria bacterium]
MSHSPVPLLRPILAPLRAIALTVAVSLPSASAFAHGVTEQAQQRFLNGDFREVARVGAEHMLTGYDHRLFLLGVMLLLTR